MYPAMEVARRVLTSFGHDTSSTRRPPIVPRTKKKAREDRPFREHRSGRAFDYRTSTPVRKASLG